MNVSGGYSIDLNHPMAAAMRSLPSCYSIHSRTNQQWYKSNSALSCAAHLNLNNRWL